MKKMTINYSEGELLPFYNENIRETLQKLKNGREIL